MRRRGQQTSTEEGLAQTFLLIANLAPTARLSRDSSCLKGSVWNIRVEIVSTADTIDILAVLSSTT